MRFSCHAAHSDVRCDPPVPSLPGDQSRPAHRSSPIEQKSPVADENHGEGTNLADALMNAMTGVALAPDELHQAMQRRRQSRKIPLNRAMVWIAVILVLSIFGLDMLFAL